MSNYIPLSEVPVSDKDKPRKYKAKLTCLNCGKIKVKKVSQQKYCSDKCRDKYYKKRNGQKGEMQIMDGEKQTTEHSINMPIKKARRPNGKCPMCKKDFAAGVKAAYKLGLQDGGNRLQQTINVIHRTNRALYDELLRLDRLEPLNVNSVTLSREQVEGIINALRKAYKFYQARKLKKIADKQIGKAESAEAKMRKILENIDEEK